MTTIALLQQKLESFAQQTGHFAAVLSSDADMTAAPEDQLIMTWSFSNAQPFGPVSGLNVSSMFIVITGRIYKNSSVSPMSGIESDMVAAVDAVITQLHTDLDLGEEADLDLFGQSGVQLTAQAGFVPVDGTLYRVVDIDVPIVVYDYWNQTR